MASISKHLLLFLFLSLFELFGVSHGQKLTALPDKEGAAGGGSDSSMQCVQKLIPCQAYLKAPEKAPSMCCSPLKKLVSDDTECLCTLFNNDDMLSNFNITQGDALKLSKACDANADISVCKKGRERSRWLLFLPGAITFGLGTWQIIRRQEKIQMLDYIQKRLELEPLNLNNASPSSQNLDQLEFRRVKCKGYFDEKRSIYVGPRSRSISGVTENGYCIITPLIQVPDKDESVQPPILVNRGWVLRSWKDEASKVSEGGEQSSDITPTSVQDTERRSWSRFWTKKPQVVEDQNRVVAPVEVVGVVRGSEKPSIFVPPNDPNSYQWFYVDVPAIARTCGLPEDTIYIEDVNENVNPGNPYPLPKDVNTLIRSSVMPQDHLNYTLTWYSLSAAVTLMALMSLKPKRSRR